MTEKRWRDPAGNEWVTISEPSDEIMNGWPEGTIEIPMLPPGPIVVPVPDEISRRQFCQGLAVAGLITKQEAIAFIQGSALPSAIQAIVDGMTDEEAAFEATMLLLGAGSFFRSHPLVLIFAMAQSMTEAEVDDFWRLCHAL